MIAVGLLLRELAVDLARACLRRGRMHARRRNVWLARSNAVEKVVLVVAAVGAAGNVREDGKARFVRSNVRRQIVRKRNGFGERRQNGDHSAVRLQREIRRVVRGSGRERRVKAVILLARDRCRRVSRMNGLLHNVGRRVNAMLILVGVEAVENRLHDLRRLLAGIVIDHLELFGHLDARILIDGLRNEILRGGGIESAALAGVFLQRIDIIGDRRRITLEIFLGHI